MALPGLQSKCSEGCIPPGGPRGQCALTFLNVLAFLYSWTPGPQPATASLQTLLPLL